MVGNLIIYFQWRGLSAQHAKVCAHYEEFSAQNAERRCVLLGGSGRESECIYADGPLDIMSVVVGIRKTLPVSGI